MTASSSRQSELFAAGDWTVLYQAFTQVNFNASDPASINLALQNYIQLNYPENYNDWIVRSEFVAIIDLLSWLAGTLAFKTDLSVRENFLETAQARSSILRLARFLSYNAARNQPAQGILKLVGVTTDDDVYDSYSTNLSNTNIVWNDPDNPNWYEQFVLILNNAFVSTNPYGIPLKQGTVGNVSVQTYRFNALMSANIMNFNSTVANTTMPFDICNGDFDDGGTIYERPPNPASAYQIYSMNDGNGNGSARTGFFTLFKQGLTRTQMFYISPPVENQIIDITDSGVNDSDVWVQTVNAINQVQTDWTKVPVMLDSNITFNALPITERNIFSVITRDNDAISIRFSDGRYGAAPSGNTLITYRVSNGLSYSINPSDIDSIQVRLTYLNAAGIQHTLYLTYSLYETISNATPAETIAQIKQRAPMVYATQNRMVSGEDYNTFPLQTNIASKIKAVNRVYSGQSRYIDLHDPTGTYQDLSLFADDGILFSEESDSYTEVAISQNLTVSQVSEYAIQPNISTNAAKNAAMDILMAGVRSGQIAPPATLTTWSQAQASLYTSTGWFSNANALIRAGSMIQFSIAGATSWVGVIDVAGDITVAPTSLTAGPVTLSEPVPTGAIVVAILPVYLSSFPTDIEAAIEAKINLRLSFSLSYDYLASTWIVGNALTSLGDRIIKPDNTIVMLVCNYTSGLWQVTGRGLSFVFESISTFEWFDNGQRAIDQQTGNTKSDTIRVLKINENLNDLSGKALRVNLDFTADTIWLYENGAAEPRRTNVLFADSNSDGLPDNPDIFYRIISPTWSNSVLFWKLDSDTLDRPNYTVVGFDSDVMLQGSAHVTNKGSWNAYTNEPILINGSGITGDYYNVATSGLTALDGITQWAAGDQVLFNGSCWMKAPVNGAEGFQVAAVSSLTENTFWTYTTVSTTVAGVTSVTGSWTQDFTQTYSYANGRGPNVAATWITATGTLTPYGDQLAIHWSHYAPADHRIDPSSQNVNDIFVLQSSYDTLVRQWNLNGADPAKMPTPPTELDLRIAFGAMEQYRMFSDAIVWRPVKYKFLFGASANPALRMQFKVISLPTATMSTGEIQTGVINAINAYFAIDNWDFGDTFYWSELAAYIHQQLAANIGSIVIVPQAADAAFGDGFEITSNPDEIFISTAQVSDVIIITSNTAANLRVR